jgi:DNA-binding winged helix-turn-helix (wHTH) protein/TolB-like protein/Flp pilus assembly protein TadD
MSRETKHFYEFGSFRVDVDECLLLRDGQPIPLQPKTFETLLALVEKSGHVISKADLMQRVWPDAFVEEANLAVNVSQLRKALGQIAGGEQYIETVPKRGYRFVANVHEMWTEPAGLVVNEYTRSDITIEESVDERVAARLKNGRPQSGPLIPVLFAAFLAAAVIGYYFWSRGSLNDATVRSVAVLPLKPLVPSSENEYLELGIADAVITRLSNLKQLTVKPTSTVRKYAGQDQNAMAAGRDLGVDAVLEGSIQRLDDRITVTVQLVRVRDGRPLWAERFNERLTNILLVEDSVAERLTDALALKLSGEEKKQLEKHGTENPEAHNLYLQGRYFWNKRTRDALDKGIDYFQKAIEKDPDYALAYAGLADSYGVLGMYYLSPASAFPKAKEAATKALALDQSVVEAQVPLAATRLVYDWDFPSAEKALRQTAELNPKYAEAHQLLGWFFMATNRLDDAMTEINRAQQIDPVSLPINRDIGRVFFYKREYDQAIAAYQKIIDMDAGYGQAYLFLGAAYEQKRMYKEAVAAIQRAIDTSGSSPMTVSTLAHAYAVSGEKAEALKLMDRLREMSKQAYVSAYFFAEIYAGLGDNDQAIDWLQRACDERASWLIFLNVEPAFDALRSDQRFDDVLVRIGFPR